MRAAEAALMASTSWGFTWSAPKIVPTTWTSLRNPSGNDGRRGRSISRQVRMAWSVARPSRRKNEPGILPAAYIRSSMSTVRGKKSVPSRTERDAVAVTSTMVSPMRPTTAPSACWASLPVSNESVRSVPLIGPDTVMASAIGAPRCLEDTRQASSQWSTTSHSCSDRPSDRAVAQPAQVTGDWQLTAGQCPSVCRADVRPGRAVHPRWPRRPVGRAGRSSGGCRAGR